jgi:hypothetical protein
MLFDTQNTTQSFAHNFESLQNVVPRYISDLIMLILLQGYWLIAISETHQTSTHHSNIVFAIPSTFKVFP